MTIDEAIAHARKRAEILRNNDKLNKTLGVNSPYYGFDCIKCSEEHEQLAEWLEDYKRLSTEKEQDVYERAYRDGQDKGLSDGHFFGYNKAIDDFAEKLTAKCDGMIKDKWNSDVAPISWAEAYADFKDDIDEIAEQLKEQK